MNAATLTAREVYQLLKDIAMGERVMARIGPRMWADVHGDSLPISVDGWQLMLFNEAGELHHCAACSAPDGRGGTFENWSRFGADPTQLLSQWERAQIEQMLRAL